MTALIVMTAAAVLILLVFSGFFSASETAITAASRARMLQLEKSGDRRAALVSQLIQVRENLIGALLLGNNIVNILASALATALFIAVFGDAGVAIATLVMTVLVVVFGEILPKTLAIGAADRFALFVSPALRLLTAIFGPIVSAIQFVVRGLLHLFGYSAADGKLVLTATEEIRGQLDLLAAEGAVIKAERDRLGGLLDLGELDVVDIMIHRTNMRSVNAADPPEQLIDEILASPFTRLPVWEEEPENIIGVLHVKDLLRSLQAVRGDVSKIDVRAIATEPWFVPDTTSLTDQLNAFLKKKQHFALVVDEYGDVQGLITLEDILEEIVGPIADEHDVVVQGVRPQPDGSVTVDGSVPIRDLNRAMDWRLPDEEATTVAGLVIHEARQIPEAGQAFTFHGYKFQVLRKNRNRITSLRVTPPPKAPLTSPA
jgi:Mg2+/Co2+ transporter CorB